MSILVYVYYVLMVVCFAFSLFNLEYKLVKLLSGLLLISITAEIIVEIIGKKTHSYYVVYHLFIPVEYALITLLLRQKIINRTIRLIMLVTILSFFPVSLYISLFVQDVNDFPSITANIEGSLVIAWCLLTLFSIEPVDRLPIFRIPIFWLTLAFLTYFVGTISINSIYNYLLANKSDVAKNLYTILNSISNYLLYIFLIIGIKCHKWEAKSLVP